MYIRFYWKYSVSQMSLSKKTIGDREYLYFEGSYLGDKFSINAGPVEELRAWCKAKLLYDSYFELKKKEAAEPRSFVEVMDRLTGTKRSQSYYLQERLRRGELPFRFDLEAALHEKGKQFDEWFRNERQSGDLKYENIEEIVKRFRSSQH